MVSSSYGRPSQKKAGWIEAYIRSISEMPYDFHVYCFGGSDFKDLRVANVLFRSVPDSHTSGMFNRLIPFYLRRRWDLSCVVESLKEIVKQEPYDLMHVHGSETGLGLVGSLTGCPVILSLQGLKSAISQRYFGSLKWSERFSGSLTPHGLVTVARGYGFPWGEYYSRQDARLERTVIQCCDAFLGKTPFDEAMIRALKPEAAYYRQGIHVRPTTSQRLWKARDDSSSHRILCISAGEPYKGLDTLVTAAVSASNHLDKPVELQIIGDISPSLQKILTKRLSGKHDRIILSLPGSMSADSIDDAILSVDMLVVSSFIENECHALLEAMRLGCPCITTSVGGIKSYALAENNTLLFDPGNDLELAGLIIKLSKDRSLQETLSRNAVTTVAALANPPLPELLGSIYESAFRGGWLPSISARKLKWSLQGC